MEAIEDFDEDYFPPDKKIACKRCGKLQSVKYWIQSVICSDCFGNKNMTQNEIKALEEVERIDCEAKIIYKDSMPMIKRGEQINPEQLQRMQDKFRKEQSEIDCEPKIEQRRLEIDGWYAVYDEREVCRAIFRYKWSAKDYLSALTIFGNWQILKITHKNKISD